MLALFLCTAWVSYGQFRLNTDRKHEVDIPFKYQGNFIVLEIMFNRVFPLRFILDTGAEHTLLTKREFADILDIPYRKQFKIVGSDMETVIYANLITGIHLDMGGLTSLQHNMLVLEEDYFQLEKMIGLEIHGIIGADLLRHFSIRIDYQRRVLTFTDPYHFKKPSKKFREYPIEVTRNKPYVITPITLENGQVIEAKLLMDTGAALALILNTNTHPDLELPDNVIVGNIGTGLGGFLEGFMGRIKSYELAGFELENVIVNFQDVSNIRVDTTLSNSRNGILGNSILSRFHIITDYRNQKIFVKPIRRLRKKKFNFDKSGLTVMAAGRGLNDFVVTTILTNSPGEEAGIEKGDIIRMINGVPTQIMSLQNVLNFLHRKSGKKIKMTLDRDGKKIKKEFRLRTLI